AGIRVARAESSGKALTAPPQPLPVPLASAASPYRVAAACVRVAQSDWDAAAASLGGTGNTLTMAFAARLARRFGRADADGKVALSVPVSVRVEGDTRANALDSVMIRA